jgi:hypothetical protein
MCMYACTHTYTQLEIQTHIHKFVTKTTQFYGYSPPWMEEGIHFIPTVFSFLHELTFLIIKNLIFYPCTSYFET